MNRTILEDISQLLRQKDKFLIIPHVRPDGDALGSSFGLKQVLKEHGKSADVLLLEPFPNNYEDLIDDSYLTPDTCQSFDDYNLCIALDTASSARLGLPENLPFEQISVPIINIDHHPDNKKFGSINYIDHTAAASSEIILSLINSIAEWSISETTATLLLTGIVMDTGCFRFDNTDPAIMRSAAQLLEKGADFHTIIKAMYFNAPLHHLQFQADLMLNHLNLQCEGRYAWLFINDDILAKYNIDIKNLEGVIDNVRAIAGVEIAAIMVPKDNGVKFSLRSKNKSYSVGKIARAINGGGHEMAAGGFIDLKDHQQAEDLLLTHVKDLFANS